MTTFPLPEFDWTIYAYDLPLFEKEVYQARFQHRLWEEKGVLYLQAYDVLNRAPVDQLFTPLPLALDPRVVKLFIIKKWLIGMTLLISHKSLRWPSMLSRLASYVTYYQMLEDLWLIGKDIDILCRWWSVESTRNDMHHSPTDELDPHYPCSVDDTVKKACCEWMMHEIWEAGDLEKVHDDVVEDVTLHVEDWINRGIVLDVGHLPNNNEELPSRPRPEVRQEKVSVQKSSDTPSHLKESSTSSEFLISLQYVI